jgi:hypothetical protein
MQFGHVLRTSHDRGTYLAWVGEALESVREVARRQRRRRRPIGQQPRKHRLREYDLPAPDMDAALREVGAPPAPVCSWWPERTDVPDDLRGAAAALGMGEVDYQDFVLQRDVHRVRGVRFPWAFFVSSRFHGGRSF